MHPLFDLPSDDGYPVGITGESPSNRRDDLKGFSALSQPKDVDSWKTPPYEQDEWFRSNAMNPVKIDLPLQGQRDNPVKIDLPLQGSFGKNFTSFGAAGLKISQADRC